MGLSGSVDDGCEILGNQSSAADETAIDVLFAQQLFGVARFHRAAVLDGQRICGRLVVQLGNNTADDGADLLGLCRCRLPKPARKR